MGELFESPCRSSGTKTRLDVALYDLIRINRLSNLQAEVPTGENLQVLERFVMLMCGRSSTSTSISKCRQILYTQKQRSIENKPATSDSLLLHTNIQSEHFCRASK